MSADQLLYFISVVVFTFGALTFCVLTVVYWREHRSRRGAGRGLAFPVFTLVCATAFVANLLFQTLSTLSADDRWLTAAGVVMALAAGLLSPALLYVVYREERAHLPQYRVWRWLIAAFYGLGAIGALLEGMEDRELIFTGWSELLDRLPAAMFGAAGALGLVMLGLSQRKQTAAHRRHRAWIVLLLSLMVLCAALSLTGVSAYLDLLPDYLVLAFFCVTLYYNERLVFFDLLVKRGAFFAFALMVLTAFFFVQSRAAARMGTNWSRLLIERAWITALLLTPLWLIAPWVYSRVALIIDRIWLRRQYTPAEAERRFTHAIQAAGAEQELRAAAEASLADVFQAPARVDFESEAEPAPGNGMIARVPPRGLITLAGRSDSIPFLSDDQRLLQSLARTLSVVLENVRFREEQTRQREREEQLSRLATRSELKALRAQINPHFLFNALNAIAGLISTQPGAAEETVEQLAEVFRYTLRKSEKEWVRLDEEIEFVNSCLRVEQARFGSRLLVTVDVDSAIGAIPVPAMCIQPLVENAVKHGASMVEDRGEVSLRAALDGPVLRIEVSDNGPGFPPGFSLGDDVSGHGLRNIAERLKGYYGAEAGLKWERANEITRVTLAMPCQVPAGVKNIDDSRIDRGR